MHWEHGVLTTELPGKSLNNLKKYLFILGCAGSLLLPGFSLVVASGGYSLAVVRGLLIAVVSLVVEHRELHYYSTN